MSTPLDPGMVNYKILILANNHLHIFLPNAEQNINWHLPPNVTEHRLYISKT